MVALNENFAPENPALGSKNRVGNFFGRVGDRAGENRPASRNRIGENRPTLTIIVSGRPYWPSRDPIGEQGGFNLYKFTQNDGVNWYDRLGLFGAWGGAGTQGGTLNPMTGRPWGYQPPSTPFAPIDGLNPNVGGLGSEVDQNEYFETKWPKDVSLLQGAQSAYIDKALRESYCKEEISPESIGAWFFEQNFLEANFVLGGVYITYENLQYNMSESKNGKLTYSWSADLIVSDGLGWDNGDDVMINEMFHYYTTGSGGIGLYPDRQVTRARWPISGQGEVDKCSCDAQGAQ